MTFATTDKAQIRSDLACLLYHPDDGAIHYAHRVVTLKGAEEPLAAAIEERARQLAGEFGLKTEHLKALLVNGKKLEPDKDYRVDPKKQRLVATKRPWSSAA
jgi:hypothetical protein